MVDEKIDPKKHYTAQEVSDLFQVNIDTVRRWYRLGYIKAGLFGKSLRFEGKNILAAMNQFSSSKKVRKLKGEKAGESGGKS